MSSAPKGYPTQKKDDLVVGPQFATVQPVDGDKYALDVHANMYVRLVTTDAVEAGSTATRINATAHEALVGDIIRMTSGSTDEERARVIKVDTDEVYITPLSVAPTAGDTLQILRHINPLADAAGSLQVTATLAPSPVQFVLDGVGTEVEEDTATPANSAPLPVKVLDSAGLEADFATEAKQDAQILQLADIETSVQGSEVILQGMETDLASLAAEDFATETTLAAVLADTASLDAKDFATETTLAAVLADTASLDAKDFATETTLAALNTKVTAVDTGAVTIATALPAGTNNIGDVDVLTLPAIDLNTLTVVDFIDTTPVLDTASTNIPASASTPVTIVASLAADVKKVQLLDTTGSFLGLYSDPTGTPVLLGVFGPGSTETLEIDIPAATVLGLRNMQNTVVVDGIVSINFLG